MTQPTPPRDVAFAEQEMLRHRALRRKRGGHLEVVCKSDSHNYRPEFPCIVWRLAASTVRYWAEWRLEMVKHQATRDNAAP